MFGGINPGQMKAMMKQMGIKQEEIDALRVIIEKSDGDKIIIEPAHVQKMTVQGQDSFQITGEIREEEGESIRGEDIELVMEKTGKSEKEVRKVLEEVNGDIAEAIVKLSD
ncbi:MAG: nascent polypeptide-associated complex protein [Nanoarchaeota archaeon]